MTEIYFVRHCQSAYYWDESDSTRPLSDCGMKDSALVTIALRDVPFDYCVCSPYIRSINTIKGCADSHHLEIHTDVRFGERIAGKHSDEKSIEMRWANHDYHEEGGESINMVQKRNVEGLHELLITHQGETILFGTHGTALSTILNYYEPDFGLNGFYRLFDWLPYVIHATFDGTKLVSREDVLILNRGY